MADSSHLERMGRELKCPICLSLLNFAVSLTCNHVFCNSCIQKSMRSGSSCPVCKVPYQRREVRPAPHMDNLVNIYKGMEVALGVNIFVTQPEPANKLPDGEKQDEGANPCRPEAGEGFEQKDENRKTTSAAKSKRSSKSKLQNSGRNSAKPSFPTSKRVQPPKCPTSEHEKIEADNSLSAKCLPSARNRECPKGREGLMLSPFFWLREEEDVEKSSQQTDLDHVTVTPLDAPRFSDIKDSDDDTSTKMSPKEEEVCSKPRDTVLFDSEMFEWTQRPCSPELCSSPVRMQVEARNEFDGVSDVGEILEHLDIFSHQEKSGLMDDAVPNNSCPGTKNGNGQNGNKRMRKSDRNTTKSRQKKRSKKDKDEADGTSSCDPKLLNNVMRHEQYDAKVGEDISKDEGVSKVTIEACNVSPGATLLCQDDATVVPESAPSCGIKAADEDDYLRKGRKTLKRLPQTHILNPRKSRKQKQNLADCCMSGPVFLCEKKRCKDEINASNLAEKSSSYTRQKTKKSRQELGSKTDQELCTKGFAPENLAHENEQLHPEFVTKVDDLNHDSSLKMDKFSLQDDKAVLRKCDTNSIKCAFCRSSEETEASGEMVHYLKGRPVSGNNDEESVIHAHKSCTEWAPNVYFEDDTVINLEVELARSRRIKCCLCGIKGAALGCYEKSCRRSFHVPCAKILQECRWDTDNFVILCPLHISSKLPCEISTSQATRRKNNVKRKIQSQQTQVAAKQDKNTSLWNSRHSSEKLVLCCSALSAAEREHVSELAMLSGATVMKNWNSSVTHVIASVDENKACRRTLKVLMAILEGKWILNIEWVQACMKAMRYVDEDPYEIQVDIHGIKNGPRLGRLRLLNKGPKLFEGFKFYFAGDFEPSYKGYLHELITTAGGTVLHRKPIAESPASWTVIIYSVELPDSVTCHQNKRDMILRRRQSDAEALGRATGSKVTSNSWVLNCIAGHMLLDL